jgi:hypothetical protein
MQEGRDLPHVILAEEPVPAHVQWLGEFLAFVQIEDSPPWDM